MKALVAFKKRSTNLFGKIIQIFTRSPYTHVELVVNGLGYSSDNVPGVYVTPHEIDHNMWDYLAVEIGCPQNIKKFHKITKDDEYDWSAIINVVIPFRTKKNKWDCTEWVGTCLKISGVEELWKIDTHKLSPADLYKILNKDEK